MYTLALDTTSRKTRLALLKKDEIVFEREWKSNANESETVIKTLQSIAETTPMLFQQLKKIITIHGPGGLNGTRIGVTISNMLLWLTKSEIVAHDTLTWWKKRTKTEEAKLKPHLLLKITEQEIFVDGKVIEFEKFAKEMKNSAKRRKAALYHAFGELTPTQHHALKLMKNFLWIEEDLLKTFGQVMKDIGGKGKSKPISPLYAKLPHITPAKKKTRFLK